MIVLFTLAGISAASFLGNAVGLIVGDSVAGGGGTDVGTV
jgi:hypothetical protein